MEISRLENLPPPPGIINSIRAGFDSIATHMTAILFPFALNLFLWLGPRLRVNVFFDSRKGDMIQIWQNSGISAEDIQRAMAQYDAITPIINLFWMLRTLPIGISSLPLSKELSPTPLGDPVIWQANGLTIFFAFFAFNLIGWVGGAIYFRRVAWVAVPNENGIISLFNAILQTVLVSILCLILFAIAMPIFSIAMLLLAGIGEVVASLVFVLCSFVAMWFIVPIFFLPHGIFVKNQDIFGAIGSSLYLTRFTLPNSSLFVLTIFLLSYGLNLLWSAVSETSWITLLAIFGHSFVTTALLAASFIYYRDMTAWVQIVMAKLKPPVKQA